MDRRAVGLIEVEAAAAATYTVASKRTKSSASGTAPWASRPEAAAGTSSATRSTFLIAEVLTHRPHFGALPVEDAPAGARSGDSDRLSRHRRRNARNRHACGRDRIAARRAVIAVAGFRRHYGQRLEAAIAGAVPARVHSRGCALRPGLQRDLQIQPRVRIGRANGDVLRRDREARHLHADDILSVGG